MSRFAALRWALAVFAAMPAASAAAQGTLGAQGFGYPPGQLSTQARALGGGNAESDPMSPLNPAALAILGRGGLYLQSESESRRVDAGGQSDRMRSYRFPLFAAVVPLHARAVIGVSLSTVLDRTWGTEARDKQLLGDDSVAYVESFRSEGGLNDVRVAGAYALSRRLAVGVGFHLFPGENRLAIARVFDDSLSFAPLRDSANVNYFGTGVSAGVLWRPGSTVSVGLSGRLGGELKLRQRDTVRSRADVPDRFGIGVRYDGLPGATVAARADRTLWSSMAGLGSERATPDDVWDFGVGVDALGPRLGATRISVRAGARRRTLPFRADGEEVRETAFSLGAGLPVARGRGRLDLLMERASRSADGLGATERAWTFGLGLSVSP